MQIININKYIVFIENNNLILYFYKKEIFCIVDKQNKILYIKNKKDLKSINTDITDYKIIENKFLDSTFDKIKI